MIFRFNLVGLFRGCSAPLISEDEGFCIQSNGRSDQTQAYTQSMDRPPEPNHERKPLIGGVWLKKVFRRGVPGVCVGVRGGVHECSAPIEMQKNRARIPKSLFFRAALKRYPQRCPRQLCINELNFQKYCSIVHE